MDSLNGEDFKAALLAAVSCLVRHRDVINALNVFPVPDGDTGTNMLLTMRAGLEACGTGDTDLRTVSKGLVDGLFWGGRGNSGVILSQFFKGFFSPLADKGTCGVPDLVYGFQQARDAAYQAVGKPVEGTMLSVIRAMAEATGGKEQAPDVKALWEQAFISAREALALTPTQLPVLAEAGVVDAGGMGIVAIIGGIWSQLSGRELETLDLGFDSLEMGVPALDRVFVDSSHETTWGYCTQFVIQGEGLQLHQVKEGIAMVADSVVVVGDEERVRVHVHAMDPGSALSYGVSLGQLSQIKIENMSQQNLGWAGDSQKVARPVSEIAVLSVAAGAGFEELFQELGCSGVIGGGQTMNPSVRQILEAVQESGGKDVILLPNNKNIVVAAEQAAQKDLGEGILHVIRTVSVPQGVSAALAFNPEESLDHNLQTMSSAAEGVKTIEVTWAVRDTKIGDISVQAGQHIGLIDGKMVVAGKSAEEALLEAVDELNPSSDMIVTVYWGADTSQGNSERVATEIKRRVPGIQVDRVYGGQPHYPYLASVE